MSDENTVSSLDAEARADQAARLLISPEPGWLTNYAVMALLAAVIAGLGMRLDSAPIVIGAMLVAPVMRPVLGLGFACLTAVPVAALRRLFAVLAATSLGLVGVGWSLTVVVPSTEVELAGEVLARTAPDIRDLLVALAAGAVGAFAILRPRVGDTITGVAIAVALVPPPVAAGIALGESFGTQARGALLLYGTNLVAIVIGTVVTVLLLRLWGERPFELSVRRLRRSAAIAVILALVVGVPLAGSFNDAVDQAQTERDRRSQQDARLKLEGDAEAVLTDWLADSDQPNLEIVSVDVPLEQTDDEQPTIVAVVLLGEQDSAIPPLDGVEEAVSTALKREIELGIRLVGVADQVASRFEVAAPDPGQSDAQRAELSQQRDHFRAAILDWAGSAGVQARITELATLDSGAIFARVALSGTTPPVPLLDELLIDAMGELPQYELVIEQLVLSIAPRAASTIDTSDSVTVAVDGRSFDAGSACRRDDGTILLAAETGGEVTIRDNSMTVEPEGGTAFTSQEFERSATPLGTAFEATFDRTTTGVGAISVEIKEPLASCN